MNFCLISVSYPCPSPFRLCRLGFFFDWTSPFCHSHLSCYWPWKKVSLSPLGTALPAQDSSSCWNPLKSSLEVNNSPGNHYSHSPKRLAGRQPTLGLVCCKSKYYPRQSAPHSLTSSQEWLLCFSCQRHPLSWKTFCFITLFCE